MASLPSPPYRFRPLPWSAWLLVACCACRAPVVGQATPVAFVDVTVLPMDSARVLEGQTVLVRDGRIAMIGPVADVPVPPDARTVPGAGRFLIPGLADMHAHFGRMDLDMFVANGVTTVRMMWGWLDPVRWRDSIAGGRLLGPSLFVAGTIIEGTPPPEYADVIDTVGRAMANTEREGRMHVLRQRTWGADFIKVYNNLNVEAYHGVVDQARILGLTVAGHVPFDVGLRGVLEAGQTSIEHLRGYVWELVPPDAPHQPDRDLRSRALAWSYADTSRFASLVELTRSYGVANEIGRAHV